MGVLIGDLNDNNQCMMKSTGYVLLQDELNVLNVEFQELRTSGELFDVTLACEDKTIEAHKVILSASSSFFREVFKKTKTPHPFVYLHGVQYKNLVSLLDYIYTGHVQILSSDVERFIQVGKELEIKSLAAEDMEEGENTANESMSDTELEESVDILGPKLEQNEKLCREENAEDKNQAIDNEYAATKEDEISKELKQESVNKSSGKETKDLEQLKSEILKRIEKVPNEKGVYVWKCTVCGKMNKKKDKVQIHVEIHLEGFSHVCVYCTKVHKTRMALAVHMSSYHKGLK